MAVGGRILVYKLKVLLKFLLGANILTTTGSSVNH